MAQPFFNNGHHHCENLKHVALCLKQLIQEHHQKVIETVISQNQEQTNNITRSVVGANRTLVHNLRGNQPDLRKFLVAVLIILVTVVVHFVRTNDPSPSIYIKFQCNNHQKDSAPCAKYDLMHFKDGGILYVALYPVTVEKKACEDNRKMGYFKHHIYVHYVHIILNDDQCHVILEDSKTTT
ncbi:uncharacterized protein LOC128558487 [Mercenaria mercenaria]|uniref:uncharacterized protein LOC128558487 n=1 Tax=Mercenaria mercenaria TaxID=6596 RepID=UPI00234F53E9|nr:uncharacterized protein LOC128558487 [Mercenaria mercenaria]